PEPPSRLVAGIPPELERVVLKLLEKEPTARYPSAHDVLEDLGVAVPAGRGGTLLSAPLVEREAELARISEGLADVAASRGTAPLLFAGASGMSKSRLVEELRFRAQLENLPCVIAANHEFAGAPYAPVMALLRGLMPAFKAHVRPALDRLAPVLVKLLPELAVEPLSELDPPSKEKMRLMAAITELLGALARTAGLVLALEDWQWADPLSDEFLSYLLRNAAEWPLLVVLTMREAPVGGRGWLDRVEKRPLRALSEDGIRRMLAAMLGSEALAPSFVSSVAALSEGNPYFVEMLLEHLVTSGTLQHAQRRWNTEIALTHEHLPHDLRGLQLRKLMRLSEDAQAIARAAAVVGYGFGIELLKGVSGFEDERLFAALDELVHGAVFVLDEQGDYYFVQDQLQEVLFDGMAIEERTQLHTRVALVLESALAGAPLAEVSLERLTAIADQFMRGDAPDKTVRYCLETGRRSAALLAGSGAAIYLEAGMQLLRDGHGDKRLLLDYLHQWGDVQRQQSDHERADEAYLEALPLAIECGDHALRANLLNSLAKSYQSQSRLDEALAACGQALEACREAHEPAETSRCLLTASRVHYLSGQLEAAIVDVEAALALARAVGDTGQSGMALAFLGYLFATTRPEKVAQGIAYLHDALKLLRGLGDKIGLINALDSLAYALVLQGDFAEARELYLEQQQLCYEIGHRNEEALCLCNLSLTALKLGAIEQALKDANGASFLAAQLQSKHPLVLAQIMEALALLYAGKLTRVQALADSALELARSLNNVFLEGHALYYRTEMALQLGQLAQVQKTGLTLKTLMERAGNPEPESRVNALLGEAAIYEGRLEEAQDLLERAERLGRATGAKLPLLTARKATVRLLISAGQWESARPVAEQALAYAAEIGARFQQAELHGLLGELALATGSGEAAEHFEAMAELAIAMPAPALLAIARFGQAAAQPYAPGARAHADEARTLLTELVSPLDEAGRQAFLGLGDRARAIAGNFIDYSLPRTRQAVPLRPVAWERL
ncbi:MAG TPA: AAA family ATPase, partial [Oscillatoriaceae cyanobacterium]